MYESGWVGGWVGETGFIWMQSTNGCDCEGSIEQDSIACACYIKGDRGSLSIGTNKVDDSVYITEQTYILDIHE